MRLVFLFIATCLLNACVSTRPQIDCQNPNWQALGVADGKMGRYAHEIARHQNLCPSTTINHAIIAEWEQGRQEGLKSYCTKSHAYQLGQHGYPLNAVCPEQGLLEIQQSHALGYQNFYHQERLRQQWLYNNSPFYTPYWFW